MNKGGVMLNKSCACLLLARRQTSGSTTHRQVALFGPLAAR